MALYRPVVSLTLILSLSLAGEVPILLLAACRTEGGRRGHLHVIASSFMRREDLRVAWESILRTKRKGNGKKEIATEGRKDTMIGL